MRNWCNSATAACVAAQGRHSDIGGVLSSLAAPAGVMPVLLLIAAVGVLITAVLLASRSG